MHIRSVLFAAALFLQGCALGPDYTRPNTPATALNTYINAPETVEDNQEASMTAWWESIDDPLLNGYVDQLLKQNLALTQASERVIQTREAITGSAAAFFPSLGVDLQETPEMPLSRQAADVFSQQFIAHRLSASGSLIPLVVFVAALKAVKPPILPMFTIARLWHIH